MSYKNELGFGVMSGLFFGIYLTTGQNIDPESLMILVGDTVNEATKNAVSNSSPSFWDQYRPLILLISLISTIGTIVYVILRGIAAIIVAILGFFGMVLLILSQKNINFAYIGLVLLGIGVIAANFLPDNKN